MARTIRSPLVLASLTLTILACEQSITDVPDPVVEAVSSVAAPHPAPIGLPVPISWWPADGDFDDHSGVNHIARGQSGVTTTDGGVEGQAFLFTGADGPFLEIDDNPSLRPDDFTIDLWAKRLGATADGGVFTHLILKANKDDQFTAPGLAYFISWIDVGNDVRHIVADVAFSPTAIHPETAPSLDGGEVGDGVWVHVALTVGLTPDRTDGHRTMTLYVDGVSTGSAPAERTGTPFYSVGSIVIGASEFWVRDQYTSSTFNGCIDEVRIFDYGNTTASGGIRASQGNHTSQGGPGVR